MDKWFNKQLDKDELRKQTLKNIKRENKIVKFSRKFSITNWIIVINLVVFFLLLILNFDENVLNNFFTLQANNFFSGKFWTLLPSMFTHIIPTHLIFNMISLFFVGNFLEKIIGRKKYIWFYIISGLFAGLFFVALSYFFGNSGLGERIFENPTMPAVGASGAIFGIIGLLAILTPFMRVYLIVGPLIAIIIQIILNSNFSPISTTINPFVNLIITIYIFISIFVMFSFNPRIRKIAIPVEMSLRFLPLAAIIPLVIIDLFFPLPIGNTAHIGGLIAGLTYGLYLRKKYSRKTKMIREYFK